MKPIRYLSLFSGLEGAHLALAPLGWECVAVAEVEPAACALLAHRLPDVPNLGDVTAIDDARVAALGRIDVVIGGSPCQDLSVAGKRKGLAGARSSLFHEQLRIFHAARRLCGARWLVWENVPGAFSSHAGRDFAAVVGALAGCEVAVPRDGWGTEGVALGDYGLVEWSVLDAQWFGVAQRRRRVFAVLDTGNWAGRPPVLLEPESLRGDSAPRREARESVAGTLGASLARCSADEGERSGLIPLGLGDDGECARALNGCPTAAGRHDVSVDTFVAQVTGTLTAGERCSGSATQRDVESDLLIANGIAVRRLTPRECERLQGVEDDWTAVPYRGKPMADGPRYKMIGNGFAVPCIEWVGRKIQRAMEDQCPPA